MKYHGPETTRIPEKDLQPCEPQQTAQADKTLSTKRATASRHLGHTPYPVIIQVWHMDHKPFSGSFSHSGSRHQHTCRGGPRAKATVHVVWIASGPAHQVVCPLSILHRSLQAPWKRGTMYGLQEIVSQLRALHGEIHCKGLGELQQL